MTLRARTGSRPGRRCPPRSPRGGSAGDAAPARLRRVRRRAVRAAWEDARGQSVEDGDGDRVRGGCVLQEDEADVPVVVNANTQGEHGRWVVSLAAADRDRGAEAPPAVRHRHPHRVLRWEAGQKGPAQTSGREFALVGSRDYPEGTGVAIG